MVWRGASEGGFWEREGKELPAGVVGAGTRDASNSYQVSRDEGCFVRASHRFPVPDEDTGRVKK